jgi:hypothetical protein
MSWDFNGIWLSLCHSWFHQIKRFLLVQICKDTISVRSDQKIADKFEDREMGTQCPAKPRRKTGFRVLAKTHCNNDV